MITDKNDLVVPRGAAWRRGYNVLQHLPFGSELSDKHLKVSDLHFLMALAEANRNRHPCINAFDALNTIPVKHQSGRPKISTRKNQRIQLHFYRFTEKPLYSRFYWLLEFDSVRLFHVDRQI